MKTVELLAPAGTAELARAAVDFGADALYIGAARFGARAAAGNTVEEVARAVEYAHRYRVRVYATLNTVLFDDELAAAEQQARELIAAGVDALIIQDMAYLEMGLAGVEFHASTQMYNVDPQRVKFLEEVGFRRVILERGLTLEQIKAIRAATTIELESFVHGAICICGSGRCVMSRTMSARSGNRGECSQPCRLTYDLVSENGDVLAEGKHLLSLYDMDFRAQVGVLLDAGVRSFKIEGRLKNFAYLANTVSAYRQLLDRKISARNLERASDGESIHDFEPNPAKTFSRGATEYFLNGKRAGVASFDTPKSLGEQLGTVTASGAGWFEPTMGLSAGDGIMYAAEGVRVNSADNQRVTINSNTAIPVGTVIYRNYDHRFIQALEHSRTRRVVDISAHWQLSLDEVKLTVDDGNNSQLPPRLFASRPSGDNGWLVGDSPACGRFNSQFSILNSQFQEARDAERMLDTIRTQTLRTGDTMFRVAEVFVNGQRLTVNGQFAQSICAETIPFLSIATINSLRREALEKLAQTRTNRPVSCLLSPVSNPLFPAPITAADNVTNRLAEQFYRRHGVTDIPPGVDLQEDLHGTRVMTTPYCIRREIGRCLKNEQLTVSSQLYLVRGTKRYRLEFDCEKCEMNIYYE